MRLKTSRGFTLIELILVIVLLSILAAVAIPKFISLSTDARIASLKAVHGRIQSSLQLFNAEANTLGIEKQSVAMTLNGVEYWNHWDIHMLRIVLAIDRVLLT